MSNDDWLAEHQGEYIETCGFVWECGDPYCGCTKANIVAYYVNKVDRRFRVPVLEWEGKFFTDHESGADEDLARYRRDLRVSDPTREAEIRWQEGVDYEPDRKGGSNDKRVDDLERPAGVRD